MFKCTQVHPGTAAHAYNPSTGEAVVKEYASSILASLCYITTSRQTWAVEWQLFQNNYETERKIIKDVSSMCVHTETYIYFLVLPGERFVHNDNPEE